MPFSRRCLLRLAAVAAAAPALAAQSVEPAAPGLVLVADDEGRQFAVFAADTLQARQRWRIGEAVPAAPRFSPDGRSVFLGSGSGTVVRRDLVTGRESARASIGGALVDFAISADGRWLLAAHADPAGLTLLDSELQPVRRYLPASLDGKVKSRVAAVFHAAARRSFVVSFDALPELWEISYDRAAPPIFDGLVHDYRMGEAIATSGFLGVRRAPLEERFIALALDATGRHVLGVGAGGTLAVLNLDVRRRIATIQAGPTALPPVGFTAQGRSRLALAGADAVLRIVDGTQWRVARTLPLPGRPAFLVTSAAAPQLWAGSQAGAGEAVLTLVDQQTLDAGGSISLEGQLLGPAALAGDGRLWVSVRRDGGDGIAVCDAGPPHVVRWLPTGAHPAAWAAP